MKETLLKEKTAEMHALRAQLKQEEQHRVEQLDKDFEIQLEKVN